MTMTAGMRTSLAVGVGAALGMVAAGGAFVAVNADEPGVKRNAWITAAVGAGSAAAIGAASIFSPGLRPYVALGAIGFLGLPAMLTTGMIQNDRDFG